MTMRSSSFFRAIKVTLLITVCTISTVIPAFSQKVPVKNIVLVHGAWAHTALGGKECTTSF